MSFRVFRGLASAMLLLALALAACRDSQSSSAAALPTAPKPGSIPVYAGGPPNKDVKPTGKGLDVADDTVPPPRTRYRIEYHNGALLSSTSFVYFIWYGNWAINAIDQIIIADLASNACSSSRCRGRKHRSRTRRLRCGQRRRARRVARGHAGRCWRAHRAARILSESEPSGRAMINHCA